MNQHDRSSGGADSSGYGRIKTATSHLRSREFSSLSTLDCPEHDLQPQRECEEWEKLEALAEGRSLLNHEQN